MEYSNEFLQNRINELYQENEKLKILLRDALDIIGSGDSDHWFGFDGVGWQEKAKDILK